MDGCGPAGRDGLEDTAEENLMCLPPLEPSSSLLLFLWVSLNKGKMLNNPHASSGLSPGFSQILHVFKDLKHTIIGYIVLCPIEFFLMFQNLVLW